MAIREATTSALQPLLDAAAPGSSRTAWGYVLLAMGAAWSSSGTTGRPQRRPDRRPKQVQNRLALRRLLRRRGRPPPAETASSVLEFQGNLLRLERSNGASSGSVPLHGTAEP